MYVKKKWINCTHVGMDSFISTHGMPAGIPSQLLCISTAVLHAVLRKPQLSPGCAAANLVIQPLRSLKQV
jgi:hypothetical protein